MLKKKTLGWFVLSAIVAVAFIGMSSFVQGGESGGTPRPPIEIMLQPTNDQHYNGAEQVVTNYESQEYTVSGSAITIGGKTVPVGLSAGTKIIASYVLIQCKKCLFGTWFCTSCNTKDDKMVVTFH
ncbi:hypothetical protein ACTJIJ_21910 [Niabella sp. 22666]|uniref:hypothetical protein n=1 Tax=Niabella sp. 22666 TaxID=3453954 RepID=UPI003F85E6F3